MKKGSREFFEVFRRGPQQEKPATWWLKRPAPPAATGPGPAEKAPAPPPNREDGARPKRIVVSLSHEAAMVLAVVLAGMLVGAFVWGYSCRGAKQTAIANASDPAGAGASPKPAVLNLPNGVPREPMKPPYYTLRVMGAGAIMSAQRAQEIVDFLRSKNYDAFVLGKSGSYTVNVGRYARSDTAEGKELKKQISSLVYANKRWFTSCYFTIQER